MRFVGFLLLLTAFPVAAKNLNREDVFIRPGFDAAWLKDWPERTKKAFRVEAYTFGAW